MPSGKLLKEPEKSNLNGKKSMNTDEIARQLFDCVMESLHTPYNQREYTKQEKIEILKNLISECQAEKSNIKLYE